MGKANGAAQETMQAVERAAEQCDKRLPAEPGEPSAWLRAMEIKESRKDVVLDNTLNARNTWQKTKEQLFLDYDLPQEVLGLSERHLNFARAYAEIENATRAAIEVGFNKNHAQRQAYRLMQSEAVKIAIDFFQACKRNRAPKIASSLVLAGLYRISKSAESLAQLSVAVRCYELMGKEIGMFVERSEHTIRQVEAMKDEDLLKLTEAYKQKLSDLDAFDADYQEVPLPSLADLRAVTETATEGAGNRDV